MKINGETVIGYDHFACRGVVVFTKTDDMGITDSHANLFEFDSEEDCNTFVYIVNKVWLKHIKSLRDGYLAINKGE